MTATSPGIARQGHLPQLDVVRAVAILFVYFYHVYGHTYPGLGFGDDPLNRSMTALGAALLPARIGFAGVPIFFVLSGFCIHYACARALRKGTPFEFVPFITRRFWRLFPAYLVALAIFTPLAALQGLDDLGWHVGTHLLLVHNLFHSTHFSINPAFWSLGIEWQFYLLYPLVLWMVARWGMRGMLIAVGIANLSYLAWYFPGHVKQLGFRGWPLNGWVVWCLGVWMAQRYLDDRPAVRFGGWIAAVASLVAVVLMYAPMTWYLTSVPVGIATAFLLDRYVRRTRDLHLWERALVPIGLVSYSLYLLHQPLMDWIHRGILAAGVPDRPVVTLLAGCVASFPVCLLLSAALYRWVELPGIALGKRLAGGSRPSPASPAAPRPTPAPRAAPAPRGDESATPTRGFPANA